MEQQTHPVDQPLHAGTRAPRLNPFAFPSETDFRFALLVVAVVGASLFLYNGLYLSLNWPTYVRTMLPCIQIASRFSPALQAASGGADPLALSASQAALAECMAPVERAQAAWMLAGLTALAVTAGALYWCYPLWKTRRGRLVPLTAEDAPEVVAYLGDLCRAAGLGRAPRFLWDPLSPAMWPVAFGRFPRYTVALPGGFVTTFATDQPRFRAVLLHELAHLRNGDVDKTYLAIAGCLAFLLVAVLPYVLQLAATRLEVDWLFSLGWRVLGMTAFVCLVGAAFLRTREVYADVRASVWDGPEGALRRVLAMLAAAPAAPGRRWRRVLRLDLHPDPAARRRALDGTDRLFRIGLWDAVGTGLAATVTIGSISRLLSSLPALLGRPWDGFWYLGPSQLAALAAGLLFGSLAAGVVGVAVWRATFASLVHGAATPGVGRAGIALGLGVLAGRWLAFEGAVLPVAGTDPVSSVLFVLWGVVLLAGLSLILRWIEIGARAWLPAALRGRAPRAAYAVGLTIAGGFLGLWVGAMFMIQTMGVGALLVTMPALAGPLLFGAYLQYIVVNPISVLAVVGIWAFPLASWLWRARPRRTSARNWAFLDAPPPRPHGPGPVPIQLRRAARLGVLAGGGVRRPLTARTHRSATGRRGGVDEPGGVQDRVLRRTSRRCHNAPRSRRRCRSRAGAPARRRARPLCRVRGRLPDGGRAARTQPPLRGHDRAAVRVAGLHNRGERRRVAGAALRARSVVGCQRLFINDCHGPTVGS